MAQVGTVEGMGQRVLWRGVAGTNDNDIVLETTDVSKYDTFTLMSTAGAMDITVSIDGSNFTTAPLSIADLGAITTAPVILTAANRLYGFRGIFRFIRIRQNGSTGVVNAALLVWRSSG